VAALPHRGRCAWSTDPAARQPPLPGILSRRFSSGRSAAGPWGVVGQKGDQFVFECSRAFGLVMVQNLDLHLAISDQVRQSCLFLVPTVLSVFDCIAGEGVLRPSGGSSIWLTSPGARCPCVECCSSRSRGSWGTWCRRQPAAVAGVAAHLHRLAALCWSPCRACAGQLGHRVVLHVPGLIQSSAVLMG
jgi:hypothetical protein